MITVKIMFRSLQLELLVLSDILNVTTAGIFLKGSYLMYLN